MFETDRISPEWVAACNRMDEVWVPSRFNVETFANVNPIILNGGAWFASIGTEESKGTKVFALTGAINDFDHDKVKADAEAYALGDALAAVDVEAIRATMFDSAI